MLGSLLPFANGGQIPHKYNKGGSVDKYPTLFEALLERMADGSYSYTPPSDGPAETNYNPNYEGSSSVSMLPPLPERKPSMELAPGIPFNENFSGDESLSDFLKVLQMKQNGYNKGGLTRLLSAFGKEDPPSQLGATRKYLLDQYKLRDPYAGSPENSVLQNILATGLTGAKDVVSGAARAPLQFIDDYAFKPSGQLAMERSALPRAESAEDILGSLHTAENNLRTANLGSLPKNMNMVSALAKKGADEVRLDSKGNLMVHSKTTTPAGETETGVPVEKKVDRTNTQQEKDPVQEVYGNMNIPLMLAGISMMKSRGSAFDSIADGLQGYLTGKGEIDRIRKEAAAGKAGAIKSYEELEKMRSETILNMAKAASEGSGGMDVGALTDDLANAKKNHMEAILGTTAGQSMSDAELNRVATERALADLKMADQIAKSGSFNDVIKPAVSQEDPFAEIKANIMATMNKGK